MSPIGKVFLLVNFLLAGCFLAWASTALSANARWKKQHDDEVAAHAATRADLEGRLSELQNQMGSERTAKEARTAERDQAQADAARNKEERDAEKRANEQLRADIAAIKETLDGYNQTIQNLEAAKDAAVTEARTSERERDEARDAQGAAESAKRDAEEASRKAGERIAELEREITAAKDQVGQLDTKLQTLQNITGVTSDAFEAQPQIEGRVLQVDRSLEPALVSLNVGKNSGVKRGMKFEIFDGSTYKGYVRVENVHDIMSSAVIMAQVPGTTIVQGDSAATNL
jgi:DNA repair exonuclease SbcCD ATPase subunit